MCCATFVYGGQIMQSCASGATKSMRDNDGGFICRCSSTYCTAVLGRQALAAGTMFRPAPRRCHLACVTELQQGELP